MRRTALSIFANRKIDEPFPGEFAISKNRLFSLALDRCTRCPRVELAPVDTRPPSGLPPITAAPMGPKWPRHAARRMHVSACALRARGVSLAQALRPRQRLSRPRSAGEEGARIAHRVSEDCRRKGCPVRFSLLSSTRTAPCLRFLYGFPVQHLRRARYDETRANESRRSSLN